MLRRLARLTLLSSLPLLAACGRIEAPEKSGELLVAIRNGPSSYEANGEEKKGFEYDLVEAFASQLKVKPRYIVAGDQGEFNAVGQPGVV